MIKSLVGEESLIYKSKAEITDEKKAFEHSHARYIRLKPSPCGIYYLHNIP